MQRLQEITDAEIGAELGLSLDCPGGEPGRAADRDDLHESLVRFWDANNAERGRRWATNPWVWAITFRVC